MSPAQGPRIGLALVILALTLTSCARLFPSDPGEGGYTGASIDDSACRRPIS